MTAETIVESTPAAAAEPAAAAAAAAAVAAAEPTAAAVVAAPAAAATEPAPPAEIDYTFTTPEGATPLDAKRVEAFTALAKEMKLPADAAQRVVDMAVQEAQAAAEAHTALVQSWADEVKADKTLGGDNLTASAVIARKAIDLGPPELKALLNSTGLGNHPAVFRWAHAIGLALSEDTFRTSNSGHSIPPGSIASRLYGTPAVQ